MKQIEVSDEEFNLIISFRETKMRKEAYEKGINDAARIVQNWTGDQKLNDLSQTILSLRSPWQFTSINFNQER